MNDIRKVKSQEFGIAEFAFANRDSELGNSEFLTTDFPLSILHERGLSLNDLTKVIHVGFVPDLG